MSTGGVMISECTSLAIAILGIRKGFLLSPMQSLSVLTFLDHFLTSLKTHCINRAYRAH